MELPVSEDLRKKRGRRADVLDLFEFSPDVVFLDGVVVVDMDLDLFIRQQRCERTDPVGVFGVDDDQLGDFRKVYVFKTSRKSLTFFSCEPGNTKEEPRYILAAAIMEARASKSAFKWDVISFKAPPVLPRV
jgi:hypothetical protein